MESGIIMLLFGLAAGFAIGWTERTLAAKRKAKTTRSGSGGSGSSDGGSTAKDKNASYGK